MKKFYLLLSAAILAAGVASAQTLTTVWQKYYTDFAFDSWGFTNVDGVPTPNWNSTDAITNGYGSRLAVGMNGKIYTLNCKTMSIMEVCQDGTLKDVYKLPSLAGQTFNYNEMDEAFTEKSRPSYYGIFITRDDAGHFLVGQGFTTNAVPYLWTIYDPATQKAKSFNVKFTDASAKYAMLRIDIVGRAMGNVLQDGGIAIAPVGYTWPTIWDNKENKPKFNWATYDNVQKIKFINFYSDTENNTDVNNVEAEGEVSQFVYLNSKTANICQPIYNGLDEFNAAIAEKGSAMQAIIDGTVFYSKGANEVATTLGTYNGTNNVTPLIADQNQTDLINNYSGFGAFDTFVLQGKRYYVATYQKEKPTKTANNSFAVFDAAGKLLVSNEIKWETDWGFCSISTEIVDDTTANIYLFGEASSTVIPGVAETSGNYGVAGVYKFTVPEATGIADVAVDNDENAAPVYYNLQGVEVANPENGIYVVRRGNKVSKEFIR